MIIRWLGEIPQVGVGAHPTHAQARQAVIDAFTVVFGHPPSRNQAMFAQAVSLGESYYGSGCFKNRATGTQTCNTYNMGAVQCKQRPPCPPGCFEATDTHANGEPYQACFRQYASFAEGMEHFIRTLYIGGSGKWNRRPLLDLADAGDIRAFSTKMRETGYFELHLEAHVKGLTSNLQIISKALNEPMPSSSSSFLSRWGLIEAGLAAVGIWFGYTYYKRHKRK